MHRLPRMSRAHASALALALAIVAMALGPASQASAQAPDLREVRPDVILLVDTSASMDYAMGSASGLGGQLPVCTGNAGSPSGRSRWITLLEALTGSYSTGYYCTSRDRRTSYVGAPDQFATHPYAEPSGTQASDGVLDSYLDRVRFGLMTFDNLYGLNTLSPASTQYMVPTTPVDLWAANASAVLNAPGDYSYGNAYPLRFPGCTTTYMVNGGVRRARTAAEAAFGGSLVSVGPVSQDVHLTNATIQTALLASRPFGSTPTGAMLDDLRYYLTNDPDAAPIATVGGSGDPYQQCRNRYAILITDGESSDPFRTSLHCDTGSGNVCPYDLPVNIAADLCRWDGTQCTGLLDGLFVVAYATSAGSTGVACTTDANCMTGQTCISGHCSTVTPELNDIARLGGTTQAILALDRATLLNGLSTALDMAQPGTTTRTAPSFTLSSASYAAGAVGSPSAPQEQFQINTGFNVTDSTSGLPWRGTLDRTRWVCDATLTPVPQPLQPQDRFADLLTSRNLVSQPRRLLTAVVPAGTQEGGIILAAPGAGLSIPAIYGTGSVPLTTGATLSTFDGSNAAITPQHFGLVAGDMATRSAIFDWVHGRAPAARASARLGDIYHSTPQIVTPPRVDIDDQAYALFRQRAEVSGRPAVVYVGTNDGVLHAFAMENDPTGAGRWTAGQELWGFVPPALMPGTLNSGRAGHQFMVDGTPVVRDVVLRRAPGDASAADMYHSVLVVGLRGGGNVYVALDVTDPLNPAFLWQWRHDDMGQTYGRPAIGQVLVNVGSGLQERAVAILPGGAGEIDTARANAAGAAGCTSLVSSRPTPLPGGVTSSRANRRCWLGNAGRSFHVVDIATGQSLFTADHTTISSPITGGVSLFSGDLGQFATRAYVTDADGVLWRLDMSSPDRSQWTFVPMHDLFWADGATVGQGMAEPPVVSVDNQGDPVVVVGAGDLDNLESLTPMRVASITEHVDHTQTPSPSTMNVNWEIRLQAGEQVTGPMELYANTVYFATWQATTDPTNACATGRGRLWGVDYLNAASGTASPYTTGIPGRFPRPGLVGSSGAVDTYYTTYEGQIVVGLGITQRPNCSTGGAVTDTYLGSRYQISNLRPGQFQLVAQISNGSRSSSSSTATAVQSVTVNLQPPPAMSRMLSFQPAADF